MRLSQLGEFGLIDRISRREPKLPSTIVGIGDDAAVLKILNTKSEILNKSQLPKSKSQKYLLVTTDTFIENVHFRRQGVSFYALGYKALAANISDIAAMGGWPTHALVTVGFPKALNVQKVDELYRGIDSLVRKHKIDIIGGDTVASPKALVISITLLGEVEKENLLLRSTARGGDLICVTGKFGGPAAKKFRVASRELRVKIKEARIIAKSQLATSMIDSSDGLVRSVLELCRASRVGARIREDKVPIARGATLDQALYGGEEYELVFTVPGKDGGWRLKEKGLRYQIVGEIVGAKSGVKLVDTRGRIKPLRSGGYEHFKR